MKQEVKGNMSHVDDGMLHAYLDGGLSALDAVRVERHVADCGACQLRLDRRARWCSERRGCSKWASPPADRAAPPLADLRPAVGAPRWRVPVAWAATIVVALGVGIYGGRSVLSGGTGPKAIARPSGPGSGAALREPDTAQKAARGRASRRAPRRPPSRGSGCQCPSSVRMPPKLLLTLLPAVGVRQ